MYDCLLVPNDPISTCNETLSHIPSTASDSVETCVCTQA